MSNLNFDEFARRTLYALKEIERDLQDSEFTNEEWCDFLQEELEDEGDIEERDFIINMEAIAEADRAAYETLSIIWEDHDE